MKKLFAAILILLLLMGFVGCSDSTTNGESDQDIYVISNRFFFEQMHGIQQEPDDFIGRTIRYTGLFMSQYWEHTGEMFYFVFQPGSGCCSPGTNLGFEVYLNDIAPVHDMRWVELTGVLETYEAEGFGEVLRVRAVSMEIVNDPELYS